eukprot:GEMP01100631.1.p1 GENE.GEMP01100631.1~~GEMP01100631.1.p1  ORF type:complete len:161 (+),score=39.29 GEMP01100631.1:91-573(+)
MAASRFFGPYPIAASSIFHESKLSYAFVNLKPICCGHVLVSPQRVTARLQDLNPDEVQDLFTTVQAVGRALTRTHAATSLTVSVQDGPEAGQTVPHVHVHVMARNKDDKFNKSTSGNDAVYKALDESEKRIDDDALTPRTLEEMAEEASVLRASMGGDTI